MDVKKSGIRKALPVLTFTFFVFALILVWCFFTLNHSNFFHQLNIRHFKYTSELSEQISEPAELFSDDNPVKLSEIRQTILNIRQQPIECLSMIGKTERFIMNLVGTEMVVDICKRDLESANKSLLALADYESGILSRQLLQEQVIASLKEFRSNSTDFELPVEKTVKFVANITLSIIILSSVVVLLFAVFISRAVSAGLTSREEAMNALEESEKRNKELAHTDTLTGLPNRNLLDLTIDSAISRSDRNSLPFAVMFIDLDHFKDINDSLGHTMGDRLLVTMAQRISEAIRATDVVVRFGGDEFVAVTDCFEAIETIDFIAHRILKAIEKPVRLGNNESYITGSIGVACYPQNGANSSLLLKHADTAMYQAKNAGKNQYQAFDKISALKQNRKLKLVSQLHHAIANNEFSLVYQPIIRLVDGATVGSEALLRWTNIDNESIGPDEFIPIAEHSGQIIDIGNWVLQQACKQCKAWHDEGATHHAMAINVSSHQLKDPSFAQRLEDILVSMALPAHCIHIEVTENIAIMDEQACVASLHKLSELGVQLLLDDFGTGYSCLSYLKNLPFDVLKIDKSFMPANNTIATTIIAMGHELDMEVVAEGIETNMCYALLKKLNCQYGQGYLFQKPVPATEFDIYKHYECTASA
ncbi:EAL domain-containing protein [Alteromonas sp. 1_MG-2023]|uniref:putative bifunctional diguanylate cyclase/phosphodiesterase n=1 Tax=Alteromonas sp. 1_MG-2023 TaxID=3062669 RepID=UPI0026E2CC44|nr:EAL domain-containing protein [Alteromonas sp. 1_MG-2023]MDO6566928.1 EAL domain-containing protein [Alteromonas sp. 1_MG-2023]